ncbi:MAG TPA: ankyrin repeat domain-containing protein [Planctomycetota bacterium]|nr:ankyrin repeat domain-containing protein [Planctomycetota bacterium]
MRGYLLLLSLVLVAHLNSAAEDTGQWAIPTKRPALEAPPPDSPELAERYRKAEALRAAVLKELELLPPHGLSVNILDLGGPGEKAGLKVLDVILKVGDNDAKVNDDLSRDADKPRKLTVHRYGQAEQNITVPEGKLGMAWRPYHKPHFTEWGAIASDPRWDAHMTAFKNLYDFDPSLAELELRRALASGMLSSPQTDTWMAHLAVQQAHFAQAMDYAWFALAAKPENELALRIFVRAAVASNNAQAASDLLKQYPGFQPNPGSIENLALATPAALEHKGKLKSPLAKAADLMLDDITLRAEKLREGADGQLKKIAEQNELYENVKTDHYFNLPFRPSAKQMLLTCNFTLDDFAPGPAAFPRYLRFHFNDYNDGKGGRTVFALSLGQEIPGAIAEHDLSRFPNFWHWHVTERGRIHALKIAVVDNRVECELDGASILNSPLPNDIPLIPRLYVMGVKVDMRNLRIDALLEPKEFGEAIKGNVNQTFAGGETRLHRAAERGLLTEAGLLLDAGADPKLQDSAGRTALHLAARSGQLEMLRLLLERGGVNDFAIAGALGDEKALAVLKAKPAYNTDIGWSALHGAAAGNQLKLAKTLLDAKENVNAATAGTKETPLMWAARLGHKEMVALLLESGADPKKQDSKKRSAAELARWNGFEDLAKTLDGAAPAKAKTPPKKEF